MAYYAALVSLLELLEEIKDPEHPYSKSLLEKRQIVSLYVKFSCLQELLENYPPKLVKEKAGPCFGRRIRDATYQVQDIIESHISDWIRQQLLVEGSEEFTLDNIVGEEFYEGLDNVEGEVDSIMRELTKTHGAPLQLAIKDQLFGKPSSREVISIIGVGGLGKTTLVRNIFDDKLIGYHFDCRSWVTVAQDYDVQDVLLSIVNSLNINTEELHGDRVLEDRIYKHLKGRRYLIIMDDLWDTKVWDDIRKILRDDSNGSRVMITTRLSDVAAYTSSSGFTHQMQFLNEDQSWNLFSEKVSCPTELVDIGRLIASHCRGIPLAIVVVVGLLSKINKTRHDWGEIARRLASTGLDQNDEDLSNILSLSYDYLPHHLKPCFLYLGCFPEDYEIHISKLIKYWIAEGFLRPVRSKSLEEVGKESLEDLVSRGLVFIAKKGLVGKFKSCGIHDLLRNFCLRKAHYENFLHVHPESIGHVRRKDKKKTIFIGPWGGSGGSYWDDAGYSGVREIMIEWGICIDSICILYDKNGTPVLSAKHGGDGGNGGENNAEVKLQFPDEYLTCMRGRVGTLYAGDNPIVLLLSLTFKSNWRTYGPFGDETGTPFSVPIEGGKIVGFRGRSGLYLDAIGLHIAQA